MSENIVIVNGEEYLDEIKELIAEYAAALGRDLEFQGISGELEDPAKKYTPPEGRIFAAAADGHAAGCAAFHRHTPERCEMKRLYVRPEYRRCHAGGRLVEAVIGAAREDGYREIVLDTIKPLESAVRLYKRYGFREIPPYYGNPMEDVIYMGLDLSG